MLSRVGSAATKDDNHLRSNDVEAMNIIVSEKDEFLAQCSIGNLADAHHDGGCRGLSHTKAAFPKSRYIDYRGGWRALNEGIAILQESRCGGAIDKIDKAG